MMSVTQGDVQKDLTCDKRLCRLASLQPTDSGTYHCSASNTIKGEEKTAETSIVLNIVGMYISYI